MKKRGMVTSLCMEKGPLRNSFCEKGGMGRSLCERRSMVNMCEKNGFWSHLGSELI